MTISHQQQKIKHFQSSELSQFLHFGMEFTLLIISVFFFCYNLGFVQWAILVQLTKFFYKLSFFLPKSFRSSWAATALVYIAGSITMNYIGMAVVLLEWENMIFFYSGLYYSMTIAMVVCLLLSFVIKTPKKKKKKSQ